MQEEFEEKSEQQFDAALIVDIVRRRHVVLLLTVFLVWLAVWGSSWFLPRRYKSTTTILVEQPTMPKNYVVPNINDDLQARLESLQQQILSPTRLLLIIDKHHLYASAHRTLTPDEKVQLMTRNIHLDTVLDTREDTITGFSVSFTASDPHVAQEIASELTNLFIEENLRVREQESQDTTQFMEKQVAAAREDLAEQDARVHAFEAAHEGSLPSDEATNLQILSGLQSQLQNEQESLDAARQQQAYHQSMVDNYRTLQVPQRGADGAPTGLAGLDQEIETLRTKLADLSTRYTDQYPEVQEVKGEIAKAVKERDQLAASLKKAANGKAAEADGQTAAGTIESAPLLQLQSQLRADQVEIANRQQAIASVKARINEYQGRLSAEPAVAQQMADLSRGYDQSQTNYNDLLKKENDSQMATSMEQMQEGERFTQLDPPNLPLRPEFPNRLKMCGAGLGAGLALGLLLLAGLEFFDDRMHGDKAIRRLLPMAVISEIPEIVSPLDEQRNRRRAWLGWSMAAVVLVIILAGSAFSYLHA
jgi:polysaccharide biosynthesis transport protein